MKALTFNIINSVSAKTSALTDDGAMKSVFFLKVHHTALNEWDYVRDITSKKEVLGCVM